MRCPRLLTRFSNVTRQQGLHAAKLSRLYGHISITDAQQLYRVTNLTNAQIELASLPSSMLDMLDYIFQKCLSVRQLFSADSQPLQ